MDTAVRALVWQRAESCCEYCGLRQSDTPFRTFHIDHIIPRVDGGTTTKENLALACVSCSLRKGARRIAIDPESRRMVALYNPRRHGWQEHFRWEGVQLLGRTATGRATVEALTLNRLLIVAIRQQLTELGRHPPTQE